MCFRHSAIATGVKLQVVRRKLLILSSACVFAACAEVPAALCVLRFLIHQCVWIILKDGVREGRVIAILETDEKISCVSHYTGTAPLPCPAVVRSWFLTVFAIPSLLCLDVNLRKRVLTGKAGNNQPKCLRVHTMLDNVMCIFFIPNAQTRALSHPMAFLITQALVYLQLSKPTKHQA